MMEALRRRVSLMADTDEINKELETFLSGPVQSLLEHHPCVVSSTISVQVSRNRPSSAKVPACPPAHGPDEECGHETLDAAHVQGSAPIVEGRESTAPEKTAEFRRRKAKAQGERYRGKKQPQLAVWAATPAATQEGGPQSVACQDRAQPAAAPIPKQGIGEKARKHIASPEVTVCPPALSPEEEERKRWMSDAASDHPGSRQGTFRLQ